MAKIVSVYGKNGFVRIVSYSDFPDRFYRLEKVFLDFYGDKKEFLVEDARKVKNYFTLKFKNFDSDNDVRVLLDKEVFVDSENLIKLPENYFFIHDLVGSKVLKNNESFGMVEDIINSPANDVYVIRDLAGNEVLIPAVDEFIESVDPQNKVLVLKPGKDLYED